MKTRIRLTTVLLLVYCFCIPLREKGTAFCQTTEKVVSQVAQTDKIDSYIKQKMESYRIPGVAIAIVDKGTITLEKAYGLANLETETPVKTNSVFELASLTKPFTATAIMLLIEEGKVQLDNPISTYIDNTPEAWRSITVRHLLTHTAGFPGEVIAQYDGSPLMDVTTQQIFSLIARTPLLFVAGERALYSDPGYILLGMVIEKASGQSYREFIQKRIFEPLKMTDSSVLDQWRIIKNRASPYAIRNGKLLRGRRDWQVEMPSNFGVFSTLEDLARFDVGLRRGTLLKKTSLEQMWTPTKLNSGQDVLSLGPFGDPYGFGWQLGDIRGHRIAEHGGFAGTHMLRFLDEELTIIVLTNLDRASGNRPDLLARGIAGLLKRDYESPHLITAQTDPRPQTTQNIRTLLSELAEGKASSMMTPAYLAFFNTLMPRFREDVAQRLKTLRSFTYITTDEVEGRGIKRMGEPIARICYYKGELGQQTFDFTFWLAKDGKVAHLRFNPE